MRKAVVLSILLALVAGIAAHALPSLQFPTVWATVTQVLDGNTIVVAIVGADTPGWNAGSTETVRYLGSLTDGAMETFCGALANQVNYQMTFGRLVYLEFDQVLRDADGALLAYVYLDGGGYSMVNAALVALGLARAVATEPNTRYSNVFLTLEAAAAQLGLGCLNEP